MSHKQTSHEVGAPFPPIAYDRAAYRRELTRFLHDPFLVRLVNVGWHGTEDLLPFIASEPETYRADLALIRQSIPKQRAHLDWLRATVRAQDAEAAQHQQAIRKAETEGKYHRDPRSGVLTKTDLSGEILRLEKAMAHARQQADVAAIQIREAEQNLRRLTEAGERLTVGLMTFFERQQSKADTPAAPPPAPIINVTVEAPVVNLEAQIDVPPVQIAQVAITSLPDRVTTTEIERNAAGDIVKSTQVESDA